MSSSMALRRSPKPGAFTAHDLQRAAQLVHDQRRQGLALDVLGDDEQRLAGLGDLLEQREDVLQARRSSSRGSGCRQFSKTTSMFSLSVTKYGREVAVVELHPLDEVEGRLHASWPLRP